MSDTPGAAPGGRSTRLALVGCTASGKSSVALDVATELGDLEIVTVDSMQVYRGMDIGTAKPTPAEQRAVPHHLLAAANYAVEWHSYPMPHSVCPEEVAHIATWLRKVL